MLLLIESMVREQCERLRMTRSDYRFSRRDVRRATGWSDPQVKRHLHKLEELEYVIVHRGGRGQSFVYELFFECPADPALPFLPGLRHVYGGKKDGAEGETDGPGTPAARVLNGGGAGASSSVFTGMEMHYAAAEA